MCLILFAYRVVPGVPLIVAANRDEYFARPAAPAAPWTDAPSVLAGRDLLGGGTWLGVSRAGRFAALTNFRNPATHRNDAPSRGALVRGFLTGAMSAGSYVQDLVRDATPYNGFCLLVGDGEQLMYYSNRAEAPLAVEPGIHGLSNHLLDTPWPKVVKGRAALEGLTRSPFSIDDYLAMLDDTVPADERDLPEAGADIERERRLSSLRILSAEYGTRCSTVVRLTDAGTIDFAERTYGADGEVAGEVRWRSSCGTALAWSIRDGAPWSRVSESKATR
ncbi:MAG TPA: NRDE family protein [Candidatus Methylomirabilis sp.]|nr:NRDE family protein [Candidatus Methylomirabilis sp.]